MRLFAQGCHAAVYYVTLRHYHALRHAATPYLLCCRRLIFAMLYDATLLQIGAPLWLIC